MGKASRKLVKKQQNFKAGEKTKNINEDKEKIAAYKESGDYEEALLLVIDLLEKKCYDIDVIFDAAELYFMTGDYERTAIWINKTLEFNPGHIDARLLLAHTCMLSDRLDDALKILEFVLRTAKEQLSAAESGKIKELLEYFEYTADPSQVKQSYPHIAAFLKIEDGPVSEVAADRQNEAITAAADKNTENFAVDAEDTENEVQNLSTEKEVVAAPIKIEEIKKEIETKQVSLQQKILLYNSFAGACFFENRLPEAEELLKEALKIDSSHTETLRNIIELSLEQGNKEKALTYVSKLPIADFSLLKQIKET